MAQVLSGVDNDGKPRQEYADQIAAMSEEALLKETEQKIWLSSYANNNPSSDFHWQCDACSRECYSRGPEKNLYAKAYKQAERKCR